MSAAAITAPVWEARPALAQTEAVQKTYSFDISATSLASGITEIGRISGWRIAYTVTLPPIGAPRTLKGTMTVPDAVSQLLRGTGLTVRLAGDNSLLVLDPQQEGAGSAVLDPVVVEDTLHRSTLPPAYAGGQVASGGRLGVLGDTDIMDAPVSITSYTSEKIADQQAQSIAEVLKNDPSVRTPNSSGGMLDTYQIRGFNINTGNSGEVAFDGVYGVAPTYRALPDYVERVEVIKGPAALLGGMAPNSGVGGIINIVPKRAGEEDLNRVTAEYGLGDQAGAKADVSRRFGKDNAFGVRLNGGYQKGDTYLDNQSREASQLSAAIDYEGEDLRASLDLINQAEHLNAPFREYRLATGVDMPSAPDGHRNVVNDWEWSDAQDRSGMLKGEYDLADELTFFGGVGVGQTQVDRLFGYPIITSNDGDVEDDSLSYMRFQTERWTANAGLRGEFDTAVVHHKAVFEASQYQDIFRRGQVFSATDPLSNIYDPVSSAPIFVAEPDFRPKISRSTLTGFTLADTLSMLDDKLLLTFGARHQSIEADNFSATTGAITSSYDDSAVTPMAGVVVKPWEQVSFYGNYLEGLSKGDIAPSTASNAGEAMKPYVAKQIETGVKLDFGSFGATAGVFQITKQAGQLDGTLYTADGEQRNRGIELTVFGEVTPDLRLMGGVMFLDAELTKTNSATTRGNRPVGVPEMQANLTAEWDASFLDGLTFSGTLTRTSQEYINTTNTQEIPGWTTLDLGARYKTELHGTPVTVRFTVQNVTDENYWSGVNEFSMVSLGAPRTALLSVSADF
jgi:iron complex outermembrane receptor protein